MKTALTFTAQLSLGELVYYLLKKCLLSLFIAQEEESVRDACSLLLTAQPCIIIRGRITAVKEAILVVERIAVATCPPKDLPLLLVGAFYAYNMHYPEGCKNFYTFFEIVFLGRKKPAKKTRLSAIIAKLQ